MIVFVSNPDYIPVIGYHFNRPVKVFNLSSLYSGYTDLTDLLKVRTINNTGMPMPLYVESVDFDLQYASALFNDPNLFGKLMMILSATYEGSIVILLVQRDPYRDAIMESLIKLIQQRYGYNCWIIEEQEDIYCMRQGNFTPSGLTNLNNDLKRYDNSYSTEDRTCME